MQADWLYWLVIIFLEPWQNDSYICVSMLSSTQNFPRKILTPRTKNLTIHNTSPVYPRVFLCATNRCSHKLFITTVTFFALTRCLCRMLNLSKFSEMYFHIWRFHDRLEKQKWWADVEVLLCPLDGKLRSLTILWRASEAPQLRYPTCPLTVNWQHTENRITGQNIRGVKVTLPFTFTTLFVWEQSLPKVSRAKKHTSNFSIALVKKIFRRLKLPEKFIKN